MKIPQFKITIENVNSGASIEVHACSYDDACRYALSRRLEDEDVLALVAGADETALESGLRLIITTLEEVA